VSRDGVRSHTEHERPANRTEYLASHGYIVVCPDHTGNALLTELPGGVTVSPADATAAGYTDPVNDRIADVSFLVDAMSALNEADPDGRFTNGVDLQHVGLTGHSFGGLTTLLGMQADDRFDAGAPMAPAAPDSTAIDKPVMHFLATEDRTLSTDPIRAS
jgi:predicted dienelactone hydrolase